MSGELLGIGWSRFLPQALGSGTTTIDPDGNPVLFDQHVPKPAEARKH